MGDVHSRLDTPLTQAPQKREQAGKLAMQSLRNWVVRILAAWLRLCVEAPASP
jgi:hypothetical protein